MFFVLQWFLVGNPHLRRKARNGYKWHRTALPVVSTVDTCNNSPFDRWQIMIT